MRFYQIVECRRIEIVMNIYILGHVLLGVTQFGRKCSYSSRGGGAVKEWPDNNLLIENVELKETFFRSAKPG